GPARVEPAHRASARREHSSQAWAGNTYRRGRRSRAPRTSLRVTTTGHLERMADLRDAERPSAPPSSPHAHRMRASDAVRSSYGLGARLRGDLRPVSLVGRACWVAGAATRIAGRCPRSHRGDWRGDGPQPGALST